MAYSDQKLTYARRILECIDVLGVFVLYGSLIRIYQSVFQIGLNTGEKKKAIWMDCGIHAREWIAPAFCQYFVRQVRHRHLFKKHALSFKLKHFLFYLVVVREKHHVWGASYLSSNVSDVFVCSIESDPGNIQNRPKNGRDDEEHGLLCHPCAQCGRLHLFLEQQHSQCLYLMDIYQITSSRYPTTEMREW